MPSLPTDLRNKLEHTAIAARNLAVKAARAALESLAVQAERSYEHMNAEQRKLREKLRARAKQIGDEKDAKGNFHLAHLIQEFAYEHWHRMLFARFLAENNLLIEPESKVAVSLDECKELAKEDKTNLWTLAGRFAQKMLPEIFRADDPVLQVPLAKEDQLKLEQLLDELPVAIFTAGDSLGWCYQFWQAQRKDEVNASGNKIGADELPAVTQLFTEDYMVDFLLDNTLGAWWAGKYLQSTRKLAETAKGEEELRKAVGLPGCPWKYLRFIKDKDGNWIPAAGTFDGWPKTAKELKCLDPCMGSGHFVVAMFERLVALRMREEKLAEKAAVAAVIRDNLFGLEIDPRCTQIAAFNLALAAWRRVGHCALPAMNLACSGLAPNAKREDWLQLTEQAPHLRFQMGALYDLFQKAPVFGSLINPRADKAVSYANALKELQPLLERALAQEAKDDTAHEMAVTARGLAKAAEILAGHFTLVATNVPYLGRGKQDDVLMNYCERLHPDSKADLAICFVERCLDFDSRGGTVALVTPQNWLFQTGFRRMRVRLLNEFEWSCIARLGTKAFQSISGEIVNVALAVICKNAPSNEHSLCGLDVSSCPTHDSKATNLESTEAIFVGQKAQHNNPEERIAFDVRDAGASQLGDYCECYQGVVTGDISRWVLKVWEIGYLDPHVWSPCRAPSNGHSPFDGGQDILRWEQGTGQLHDYAEQARDQLHDMHESGNLAWGRKGVVINRVQSLRAGLYYGEIYHNSVAAIVPKDPALIRKVWAFCNSPSFEEEVRRLSPALGVTNKILIQVPFSPDDWNGDLPKPFSSDPTQWLFSGHPKSSDNPLQVSVARLLGHQWPRQAGSSFPDCPLLDADGLEKLADADGIVCIPSVRGEEPAAERLRKLLEVAFGKDWKAQKELELIRASGSDTGDLEEWLRGDFFDQHCSLFHHRPFVWHIWDGRKRDGFHALVNYHKLADGAKGRKTLESLTHSYLGDWIIRQKDGVKRGDEGAEDRLAAAQALKERLEAIIAGEPPCDIFVRWKKLADQAIGWEPDLNDGVRMNIRPFLASDLPNGKKGAGILRNKPNIKWDKDRGKEPQRDKKEFPWFWNGSEFTGDRVNDVHLTNEEKRKARNL